MLSFKRLEQATGKSAILCYLYVQYYRKLSPRKCICDFSFKFGGKKETKILKGFSLHFLSSVNIDFLPF